jgi:uncharacterized SAM-binding protein YcdF (DUF218 family)
MLVRYIFKQLILPPGGLLLLLLLGWWLRRRAPSLALACTILGGGGLWVMSLPVTLQSGARLLESVPALPMDQWQDLARQADVIVVLGGGRRPADPAWGIEQPSAFAEDRLRYAARLAKASGLPLLISGGSPDGQEQSEATLGAGVLQRDFAMPVRWLEERSRNTWENARFSAELLQQQGLRRVVLVTTAAHMPRALWSFQRTELNVIPAPVGFLGGLSQSPLGGWLPEASAIGLNAALLHEAMGRLTYPLLYRD